MSASYKKLFKLLIDREMKKKDLAEAAGISIATITKMGKDGAVVSSDVLIKICTALNCSMDDFVDIIPEKQPWINDIEYDKAVKTKIVYLTIWRLVLVKTSKIICESADYINLIKEEQNITGSNIVKVNLAIYQYIMVL